MSADEKMQKKMRTKMANMMTQMLFKEVKAKMVALVQVHEVAVSAEKPAEAMLTLIPVMREAIDATEACLRREEAK
jgi:hypothetical protein